MLEEERRLGIEEEIKKGIEQGKKKQQIYIAKSFKNAGISENTGLSIEEIKNL